MSLGIRSTRRLEDACGNRLDFIWLAEGRVIDHSTFAKFRTGHEQQLKELFRNLVLTAREMGLVRLNQVTWDGTRVKASNSRHNTARQEKLETLIRELDEQFDRMLEEARAVDAGEDRLFGQEGLSTPLPPKLAQKQKRLEELERALETLKQMQVSRGGRKDLCAKGPQMPLADTDSRVLPNKEGGYAPNYTPVLAVDSEAGIVVDAAVLNGKNEDVALVPSLERMEETFGELPQQVLADSGFHTGSNLEELEKKEVEGLIAERQSFEENPARREDPTQPVAEGEWEKLPMNPQAKVLDKAAFVYDAGEDCYFCPMGQKGTFAGLHGYRRENCQGTYRVYRFGACGECPLKSRCVPGKATVRSINRDEYDGVRQRMADRLKSEAGKKAYARRWPVAEGRFGVIKSVMGVRQFLLRGLKKVRMEWDWTVTAYNLRVMVRHQMEKKGVKLAIG